MQKFIHDNEQYVLDVKRKQGKTKIDKEINSKNFKNVIKQVNNKFCLVIALFYLYHHF